MMEDAVYNRHLSMNFKEDNISIKTEVCHGRYICVTHVNSFYSDGLSNTCKYHIGVGTEVGAQ